MLESRAAVGESAFTRWNTVCTERGASAFRSWARLVGKGELGKAPQERSATWGGDGAAWFSEGRSGEYQQAGGELVR